VFLRFHSFSLVVKSSEFVRVYITNILRCYNVRLAQWTEVRSIFSRTWVHSRWGCLCCDIYVTNLHALCQAKPIILEKTLIQNYQYDIFDILCAISAKLTRNLRLDKRTWKPLGYSVLDNFFVHLLKQEVIYEV